MARIKRGVTTRQRHKKLLKLTKGHRGGRHSVFQQAKESLIKALSHAYRHRRERKGDMRRLWITRINAAARQEGLAYNQFIHGLQQAGVQIDRKVAADIAVRDPETFSQLVATAKEGLQASDPIA